MSRSAAGEPKEDSLVQHSLLLLILLLLLASTSSSSSYNRTPQAAAARAHRGRPSILHTPPARGTSTSVAPCSCWWERSGEHVSGLLSQQQSIQGLTQSLACGSELQEEARKLVLRLSAEENGTCLSVGLPAPHVYYIRWLGEVKGRISDRCLRSIVSTMIKKSGLGPLSRKIETAAGREELQTRQWMLTAVPRTVSSVIMVVSAHHILQQGSHTADTADALRFFLRAIVDSVPPREQHDLLVILCHGLVPAFLLGTSGGGSLHQTFQDGWCAAVAATGSRCTSSSVSQAEARACYSVLELPARLQSTDPAAVTGVAKLLASLEMSNAGSLVKSLRRWAVEVMLHDALHAGVGRPISADATAFTLQRTRRLAKQETWRNRVLEVGAVTNALVKASCSTISEGGIHELTNRCILASTIMAYFPLHSGVRLEYSALLGSGCNLDFPRLQQAADEGLAALLGVDRADLVRPAVRQRLKAIMRSWRSPHLLVSYYALHEGDEDVIVPFRRFLRALFGLGETLADIRYRDKYNRRHLDACGERVAQLWCDEALLGGDDAEAIFMMGEDTRSCMAVTLAYVHQNKGLLGFLLNGSCKLLFSGRQPLHSTAAEADAEAGKWTAGSSISPCAYSRAAIRLLLRSDTRRPVLLMEPPYFTSGRNSTGMADLFAQAHSLSERLDVPLYTKDSIIDDAPDGLAANRVPVTRYGFPAVELLELGGASHYSYSDAAKGVLDAHSLGVVQRGRGGSVTTIEAVDERLRWRKNLDDEIVVAVLKTGPLPCPSDPQQVVLSTE